MKALLFSLAAIVMGLVVFEVTMQPSASDRIELATIFVFMAAASTAAALLLPRAAQRSSRLAVTVFALSLVSLVVVVFGLAIAANRMFISDHDLTVVLIVLGFGLLAALGFAFSASRALTVDLQEMAATTSDVAEGDLAARTNVTRADEIGRLAAGIDEMARRLEADATAKANEDERRRQFFAAVGHDLRTPLASAQVAVEALRDGLAADPDRYYASLQRDLGALHSLVDDLFLLARIQSGDMAIEAMPTDLTDVADEAIEIFLPVATKENVELVLDAPTRVVVSTGPEAVSRVMRNLLDNAIRYAPDGSAVTVAVSQNGGASVVVSDEGPGFSEEFVGYAFDSFSRPDADRNRETDGSGLGLAIAKGFVTALDGEIWAEPGPGGRVEFTLPLTSA
ncbi:MAG: HAMP domain-containing histidine kinase [Actinomycetia bacterium]|nr:HAMP domain-containing histidine kinase [Actinomycetes bacterium]